MRLRSAYLVLGIVLVMESVPLVWVYRAPSRKADAGKATNNVSVLNSPGPQRAQTKSAYDQMGTEELLGLMRTRREIAKSFIPEESASSKDPNSLQNLLILLADSDSDGDWNTAPMRLAALGRGADPGVPRIVELLHGTNEMTAHGSARALAYISESSPVALAALTDALTDPSAQVRDSASMAVAMLLHLRFKSVDPEPLLPILLRNAQDRDLSVRLDTASAVVEYISLQQDLGKSGHQETVMPIFLENLSEANAFGRRGALSVIGQYGRAAETAKPQIAELLNDPDPQVRSEARSALKRIDDDVLFGRARPR